MPIRRIKAQSPDPYLGKIKGDTELARLAHLNYVIDEINNGNGGGGGTGNGGSIEVNGNTPVTNLTIGPVASETYSNGSLDITIDPYPGYKVYRAKIAMQTVDWPGYGYLYNWFAVTDARKLENPSGGTGLTAPNEWRVPSDTDWGTLQTFAGGLITAGGKLKSTLNSTAYPFYGWLNNGGGTDDYNFGALGGGLRSESGSFVLIGVVGFYWSSTQGSLLPINAFSIGFYNSNNVEIFEYNKARGFSVRLVREATAGELLLNDGDTSDTSSLDPYTGNDGKTYVTVKIGTQIWLAQNLRETKYNDNSDIFNASALFGGDLASLTWQAKGAAQEGAWTAYLFNNSVLVEYDPSIIRLFYNDVLENTLNGTPSEPIWVASSDVNGPIYSLVFTSIGRNWKKTHIKVTPGFDVSDYPTFNERSLLIQRALVDDNFIKFRPIKRSDTGALTIEDLNNYNDLPGGAISYVYVEILEYTPATPYYGSGLSVALGASNLEDEEEIVALTYEINGVEYTEDLEAKKLSIEIAKIYDQLGIFDKYKV